MGLFGKMFEKKDSALKQDISEDQAMQAADAVFIMHLLFEEKCDMPTREHMCGIMDRHMGENECFGCSGSTASFAALKYRSEFKDRAVPPMLMITGCTEITDWKPDDMTMSQMWDCPESEKIFDRCRYQAVATDMMAGGLEYRDRADMLMNFMEALLEIFPTCRAVMFETSGKMFTRDDILSRKIPRENRFVYFAVNVRFFKIMGTEDMMVDTVGMSTLCLPDLQYHFHGMDQNAVVDHAYNMLSYIFANDCPIKNGDIIDGIKDGEISRDVQWKCQYEKSLIQPLREVIDINMGEFASGTR